MADRRGRARWREDLDATLAHDPAARSRWEVALLYPGVHAIWAHRVAHRLWRRRAHFAARAVSQAARLVTGIEIHPGVQIGKRLFIDHGAGVVIGETAQIGDDVLIYHGVTLGATSRQRGTRRHPIVGDRVVIGAGAAVLGDVVVGAGSRIGANAVLVRSVPANSVVVGVPGRLSPRETTDEAEPEPIADVVQSLIERVEELERQVEQQAQTNVLALRAAARNRKPAPVRREAAW